MKVVKDFEIPDDVITAKVFLSQKWIGSDMYFWCIEVAKKYPKYFPKEADYHKRYSSIPQENHDAFNTIRLNLFSIDVPYPEVQGLVKYVDYSLGKCSEEDRVKHEANEKFINEKREKHRKILSDGYDKYYLEYLGEEYRENFVS